MNLEGQMVELKQQFARAEIERAGQLEVNKVLTFRVANLEKALGVMANIQQVILTFCKERDTETLDACAEAAGMQLVPDEPEADEPETEPVA